MISALALAFLVCTSPMLPHWWKLIRHGGEMGWVMVCSHAAIGTVCVRYLLNI